jgi:glycine cleavage system aminomethyltransferase T/glycine/D-amino acid oxidase-like deaminating enzyme
MKSRADVVIVGAGIVGSSAAHYLALAGVRNVVVIDQGPLENTGGSSFHAPGLVFQTNGSRLMCKLAQWSTELYRELDGPEGPSWLEVGSIEVATTPARVAELERRHDYAMSYGLPGAIISPAEAARLVPVLDPAAILSAYHVPSDGLARAGDICRQLRRSAEARGAEFNGLTRVTGVQTDGGRVRAVETTEGTVTTSTLLVCAGIWGPEMQGLIGRPIPMQPMQHLFAWTNPLPELAGATAEVEHPILRHQDRDAYYRQRGQQYGIGSYGHDPLPIDIPELERGAEGHQVAQGPFTPEHFTDSWDATRTLVPPVYRAGVAESFNGHFAFTPDSYPLLGESSHTRGLFLAEGIWVTQGGGAARAVVDLIVKGSPGIDLGPAHPDRFQPHHSAPSFVRARGSQQYVEVYDVLHPLQQMEHPRGLRSTPYHQRLVERGGSLVESAGWERAQWFESNASLAAPPYVQQRDAWGSMFWSDIIGREHQATRTACGVFDLTPFTKLEVEGPGACAWLNRVCASEMDRPVGRIIYTTILTPQGGVVCDLTITRLSEHRYLLVTGGGSGPRDVAWLRRALPEGGGVTMRDTTSGTAVIGLWGPNARDVLSTLVRDDLGAGFPYMQAREIWVEHVPALALRISYAGELGWELYVSTEYGRFVYDRLLEAGERHGAVPVGLGAFESLRIEKGYRFSGVDMHTDYTADESGLGFTVHLTKPSFVGREAVLAERARGVAKRLVPIVLDDPNASPLGGEPILVDGTAHGYVTSANFGYSIGSSIAYGYLPTGLASEGQRAIVRIFDREVGGTVCSEPLFDPKGARLRA